MKLSQDFNISTKGNNIPKPLRYWHEADISDDILEVIKDCNYEVRVISYTSLFDSTSDSGPFTFI